MQQVQRYRFWLGGLIGFAVAVAAPTGADATGRGGERFDRSGAVFDRSEGASTWRHSFGGGYGRRDPRAPGSAGSSPREAGPSNGPGGDPAAPEPTAALLFGAGLLAVSEAARRSRAR
jgi:hypothetical protein